MPLFSRVLLLVGLALPAAAETALVLPRLRTPAEEQAAPLVPPPPPLGDRAALHEVAALRAAMAAEVPTVLRPVPARTALYAAYARAMLDATGHVLDRPQLVVVVDRNPRVEMLLVMAATPSGSWSTIGAVHVSTGQAGRKEYYITPIGVFEHGDAILDFRAEGTYNEHHVRGLGTAGMRVWDFGWQWAVKGWRADGEGGDIRLQMHATDPVLLEPRLGRPASEGCIRVSSATNRFLDRHGVLDAEYERAAVQEASYRALLRPDRDPSPLAGRYLVVVDTSLPADEAPTAWTRPANWPDPPPANAPSDRSAGGV